MITFMVQYKHNDEWNDTIYDADTLDEAKHWLMKLRLDDDYMFCALRIVKRVTVSHDEVVSKVLKARCLR